MSRLTRFGVCLLGLALTCLIFSNEAAGQRGRGGGGRGRGGGGAGMNRAPQRSPQRSTGRSPSMNRQVSRPSPRPSTGPRPTTGRPTSRPATGRPATGRPATGRPATGRPATGRPATGRPATGRPATGRPTTRPGGTRPGGPAGGRPSQGQLQNFLDFDGPSTRPGTRPGTQPGGGAAGDFLQNRPTTRPAPGTRPGQRPGAGDRPGQLPDTGRPGQRPPGDRPGVIPPGNRPGQRPPGTRPPGYRPPGSRPPGYRPPGYRPPVRPPYYGGGYWGRNPNWRWGWNRFPNNNWWGWATAGAVTGWLTTGFNDQPVYYDYGTTVYYQDDNVYSSDGDLVASADEYAEQAQTIATSVPDVDPQEVDWMPLGVFALTQKDGSVEDSTLFLQLAISKEGIIAGTFQNTATDKAVEVEGTIDRDSQRAAWGPVGESWPIMETGIYNLTENEASALLHFADAETQQWTMVRMDEPKDTGQGQ